MPETGPALGYRNPIIPGFNPDPTIIRVDDVYFLATSSFEYFPGLPIYKSEDLISWQLHGHALSRRSQLDLRVCESSSGIFAPTLRCYGSRFYMTVCALHRKGGEGPGMQVVPPRGFYVWTDDIWNSDSWSDPIYYDVLGIDQDLFIDTESGKTYLSWANFCDDSSFDRPKGMVPIATFITEIDLGTGRQVAPQKLLRYSKAGSGVCEGPHIFRKDKYYYLITADGGTEIEHQQWVCRSLSGPDGPWEVGPEGTVNPMIYNGLHHEVRQTGHMDLVEGVDGRWWAVFLGVQPIVQDENTALLSTLGRETFLAPVEWHQGWPIVNKRTPITLNGLPAAGLDRIAEAFSYDLSFSIDTDLYRAGWYHLRTPLKLEHDLKKRPGSLALFGGPYDLEVDECPTMLLQKQPAFECMWSFKLDFRPVLPGCSAGTAVWWSRYAYASVQVRGVSQEGSTAMGRQVVFRYPDLAGDGFLVFTYCSVNYQRTHLIFPLQERIIDYPGRTDLRVAVRCRPDEYIFSMAAEEGDTAEVEVGRIGSRSLARTRKFDSLNTGTHFALFAHGSYGQSCIAPAFFTEVELSGKRAGGP